jgi:regulator of sigma E protease
MGDAMMLNSLGFMPANGVIVEVKPLSTAAVLGLQPGDRVVAIDGEKISSDLHLEQNLMQDDKGAHVLGLLTRAGQPQIRIFRLNKGLEEELNLDAGLFEILGISTASVFKPGEAFTRKVGFKDALSRSLVQTYDIGALTIRSIWMLISGKVPASSVGGPIMIFDVAQKAAHKGLSYYIFIMCLLSVNLGLLNLLPIPALDGGHLLLFGIEAVQRKPLTTKTRAIVTQIGFALLLALMLWAIFNDLYRLFK